MAEDEVIEQEVLTAPKKNKSKIIILLIYMAIFLIGIILMVVISNIVFNMRNSQIKSLEQEVWAPATETKTNPLKTFPIASLQINLSDPTGNSASFVKVTMALAYQEVTNTQSKEKESNVLSPLGSELEQRSFEIKDKIISIVSAKSYEDLDTPDKQNTLKREIMNQVNSILIHGVIQDIYITDFNIIKTRY